MKHFFLAIWEGIIEYKKELFKLILFVIGIGVIINIFFYFASTSSTFCSSCHIMEPYVKMWKKSIHSDVPCVKCHTEYRFLLSKVYIKYSLGIYNTRLRAEVPDSRCLSCHEHQDLDTNEPFLKNIRFSHKFHLGAPRRGKHLHCTSCHSTLRMVKNHINGNSTEVSHVTVDERVCFICHFKGAEKGHAVTGCLVCHGPPKKVVTHQGFKFDHSDYIKGDVKCELCHSDVIRGNANVPPQRCSTCHIDRSDQIADSERIHKIHLEKHEIDCRRCHNLMEHGNMEMSASLQQNCKSCHKPSHSKQVEMYIGIGGKGVADSPSTMFLSRVACDSCHVKTGLGPRKDAAALRMSCVKCHGRGYGRMVDDWEKELSNLENSVARNIAVAKRAMAATSSKKRKKFNSILNDAIYNLDFVKTAKGEHNIHYAVELLRVSFDSASKLIKSTHYSNPVPRPLVLTSQSGYCRVCHSTSHLSPIIEFNGEEFVHLRHINNGVTCDKCHSLSKHGQTIVTIKDCRSCHHTKTKVRCEKCHTEQAQLYKGYIPSLNIKGEPDFMANADVECTDCHDLSSNKPLIKGVQAACVTCHEKGYDKMAIEWVQNDDQQIQNAAVMLAKAKAKLVGGISNRKMHSQEFIKAQKLSRFMEKAKGVHNTVLSDEIYDKIKALLKWAK